jgi:hypothetical protein
MDARSDLSQSRSTSQFLANSSSVLTLNSLLGRLSRVGPRIVEPRRRFFRDRSLFKAVSVCCEGLGIGREFCCNTACRVDLTNSDGLKGGSGRCSADA